MLNKFSATIFLSILFWGCMPPQNVIKPDPQEPEDTDWCGRGCAHLSTLEGQDGLQGCLESRPLYLNDGTKVSCEQFCIETQEKGRALNPKCWTTLNACEDLETICRR